MNTDQSSKLQIPNRGTVLEERTGLRSRATRFRDDESGVMVAYTVFFLLITMLVGGIGVDLMRFEMERTRLQNTLDRAVLAAADLDQKQSPAAVVQDYFDKAHLSAAMSTPIVDEGINYRTVSATATMDVQTQFMRMTGLDTLVAPAMSEAEERVEGVEVSLVLDVSGSMGSNSRLTNLKPAARDFVDSILSMSAPGDASISIIPYNTQVSAGLSLLRNYNTTQEHDYSHCVNFEASDFNSVSLDRTQLLERTAHFDPFSESRGYLQKPVCPTNSAQSITALSNSAVNLKNQINSLVAGGNTSIDLGMKWATALLDPGTQSVVTDMIGRNEIDAAFAGRPAPYEDGETVKVIVVMTDGQNTTQYRLHSDYRSGDSNIWYNRNKSGVSVYVPTKSGSYKYYWTYDRKWKDHPYGADSGESGTPVRLTYPQLWSMGSLKAQAKDNYRRIDSNYWYNWYTRLRDTSLNGNVKDARLQNICQQAKDNGMIVYAIGFEAPNHGADELRDCASSPSHYFDVDGLEIADAFSAIAASISQLRLTQ